MIILYTFFCIFLHFFAFFCIFIHFFAFNIRIIYINIYNGKKDNYMCSRCNLNNRNKYNMKTHSFNLKKDLPSR